MGRLLPLGLAVGHGNAELGPETRRTDYPSRATRPWRTAGHSVSRIEYMAESRNRPSCPGTREGCQLRRIPSKLAPSAARAARDRLLRASVLKSTRPVFHTSKA